MEETKKSIKSSLTQEERKKILDYVKSTSLFASILLNQGTFPKMLEFTKKINPILNLSEKVNNIEKSNFDYKWLGSVSMPFAIQLIEIYEKGGNQKVDDFLINIFRKRKNIEFFKEWLKDKKSYQKRKSIIDDCLEAHLEKKYTLSIPVLLAQCDGIIIEKVVEKEIYTGKDANYVNMKRVAKDRKISIETSLAKHIESIYDKKRLGILHGKDTEYYKDGEVFSVKVIWTFFEIINTISKINET